jgi:tRNA(Ile)-lysidine synthase
MTTGREQALESRVQRDWPPHDWCDLHVVLAVSAGPDSVAMLRAIHAAKATCGGHGDLIVAHFNHGARGAAADADQAWLEALCRRLKLRLVCGRAGEQVSVDDRGDGWEAAARAARYRFLRETAEKIGARYVAVAHTLDDQVETVLHRVLRGTGLDGLAGIPWHRPLSPTVTLVRPLLSANRLEILQYLRDISQDFRTDETNADTRWTRNRLRHELLPILRERYNPGVDDALLRLAAQAGEAQQLIAGFAQQVADECVTREVAHVEGSNTEVVRVRIDCRQLANSPLPLVREVCRIAWQQAQWPLQAMGFDEWQELAELIIGERDMTINLPGGIRGRRENSVVVLEPIG